MHQRVGTVQQDGQGGGVVHIAFDQIDGRQQGHFSAAGPAARGHHQPAAGVVHKQPLQHAAAHKAGATGDDDFFHDSAAQGNSVMGAALASRGPMPPPSLGRSIGGFFWSISAL